MDLQVQKRLWLGMIALPQEDRLREYERWIAADHASQASEIHGSVDCFVREHNAAQCLSQVVAAGELSASSPQPSSNVLAFARELGLLGERALAEGWTLNLFATQLQTILPTSDYAGLSVLDRDAWNELASFYARRLPERDLLNLRTRLRERSDWARRLGAYESRSSSALPVDPGTQPTCPSRVDWERHAIPVRETSYSIPVFVPRGRAIPWALYENVLQAEFDAMKVFLVPADLEKLMRPAGKTLLHLYIGGGLPGSEALFHGCGLRTDDRGGEYSIERNHIMSNSSFREMNWTWFGQNPRAAMGSSISTFQVLHHEIGHAIYYNLLNASERQSIRRFFEATVPIADRDSDYVPNSHIVQHGAPDGRRHYAMTNETEFFAEMVTEYVASQLSAVNYGGRPFNVRMDIMNRFFAEDGLHPEVFSRESIESVFRRQGVPFRYPIQGYFDLMPSAVFNSSRGWGAEFFFGGRGVSASHFLTYGGGLYLNPGFQSNGSIGIGIEGNLGLMPTSWLGLEAVTRMGMRADFSPSNFNGVAGAGLRLRLRPNSGFQFQVFFIPQVDLGTGQSSFDAGGGVGFSFQ